MDSRRPAASSIPSSTTTSARISSACHAPVERRCGIAALEHSRDALHVDQHRHKGRAGEHHRQPPCQGVRELHRRPRLACAGVGADEHGLRLVHAGDAAWRRGREHIAERGDVWRVAEALTFDAGCAHTQSEQLVLRAQPGAGDAVLELACDALEVFAVARYRGDVCFERRQALAAVVEGVEVERLLATVGEAEVVAGGPQRVLRGSIDRGLGEDAVRKQDEEPLTGFVPA
eukprot:7391026-Prymnesium_polylepis.1